MPADGVRLLGVRLLAEAGHPGSGGQVDCLLTSGPAPDSPLATVPYYSIPIIKGAATVNLDLGHATLRRR